MRRIVLFMFATLDGRIAGPNGEFDEYEPSDEEHRFANQLFREAAGIMFGRATYEGFVGYWDSLDLTDPALPPAELEFAQIFRAQTRIVFSRTLKQLAGNDILIGDQIATHVAQLQNQPGSYYVLVCGPELLGSLVELGLVNEYRILIKPTILGPGMGLFSGIRQKVPLKLLSTHTFSSGTVMHHYERDASVAESIVE